MFLFLKWNLTAAIDGFFPSPAGGWVTSAPRKMTGCWNTEGLEGKENKSVSQADKFITIWQEDDISVLRVPLVRNQDVVDSSQFDVDLEAEVWEGLRGRLHHILHLHTLSGHAEEGVTHPLHLRCGEDVEYSLKSSFNVKCTCLNSSQTSHEES